jgi:hypothetical protein
MSLVDTIKNNARTDQTFIDEQENRTRRFGLKMLAESDTPNLVSANDISGKRYLDDARPAIPVLERLDSTITDTRSCTPTDVENVSHLQTIDWKRKTFHTTMIPSIHKNNEIGLERSYRHQLESGIRGINTAIETDLYTALDTNKTQVLENDLDGLISFNVSTHQLEVAYADRDDVWNNISSIMSQNDFDPSFNVAASWGVMPSVEYYKNQGGGNSANTAFQFGDYDFYGTSAVQNSGALGTFFVMPKGSLAIVYWVSPVSDSGAVVANASGKITYSKESVPGVGLMGVKSWDTCSDQSSIVAGLTDAPTHKEEFSIDYAIVNPYTSDLTTLVNPIVKGVLQNPV